MVMHSLVEDVTQSLASVKRLISTRSFRKYFAVFTGILFLTFGSVSTHAEKLVVGYMPSWKGSAANIEYEKYLFLFVASLQRDANCCA